jgi:hypothetical protein
MPDERLGGGRRTSSRSCRSSLSQAPTAKSETPSQDARSRGNASCSAHPDGFVRRGGAAEGDATRCAPRHLWLLSRDDVVRTEAHRILPRQTEINLLTADTTEHALIAQLGPVGQVTRPRRVAPGPSLADFPGPRTSFRPARASEIGHRC